MKLPSTSDVHMPKLTTADGIATLAIIVGVTGVAVNYFTRGALIEALAGADRGFETTTVFTAPFISFMTRTATLTKKGMTAAGEAPDIIGWLV
jgi:hypothetical protein